MTQAIAVSWKCSECFLEWDNQNEAEECCEDIIVDREIEKAKMIQKMEEEEENPFDDFNDDDSENDNEEE